VTTERAGVGGLCDCWASAVALKAANRTTVRMERRLPYRAEEEFAIACGSGDGGVDDFDVGGSGLSDTVPNAVDGELVGGGVTHDAAFADALTACFKLGFDEDDGFEGSGGTSLGG
jgi:hypothetical protein